MPKKSKRKPLLRVVTIADMARILDADVAEICDVLARHPEITAAAIVDVHPAYDAMAFGSVAFFLSRGKNELDQG